MKAWWIVALFLVRGKIVSFPVDASNNAVYKKRDMSKESSSSSGGIGFVGLLTILFIALKLTDVIAWSWLWVLAPVWISAILIVALVVVLVILEIRK